MILTLLQLQFSSLLALEPVPCRVPTVTAREACLRISLSLALDDQRAVAKSSSQLCRQATPRSRSPSACASHAPASVALQQPGALLPLVCRYFLVVFTHRGWFCCSVCRRLQVVRHAQRLSRPVSKKRPCIKYCTCSYRCRLFNSTECAPARAASAWYVANCSSEAAGQAAARRAAAGHA